MNVLKSVVNVMFPKGLTCELCGREVFDGGKFCARCKDTVTFNDGATCPVCGRRTAVSTLCLECKDLAPSFDRAASPLVYDGGGRDLVLKYKNRHPYLKEYLAELMASKCESFADAEAICFVPMTKRARRRRGYNQSRLLAKELSARLNLPVLDGAIKKVKKTEQQKSLTKSERKENLKGCFRVYKQYVDGKVILLVDDIMTTGVTAETICSLLKSKGAKKVYFLTAASVEYKPLL